MRGVFPCLFISVGRFLSFFFFSLMFFLFFFNLPTNLARVIVGYGWLVVGMRGRRPVLLMQRRLRVLRTPRIPAEHVTSLASRHSAVVGRQKTAEASRRNHAAHGVAKMVVHVRWLLHAGGVCRHLIQKRFSCHRMCGDTTQRAKQVLSASVQRVESSSAARVPVAISVRQWCKVALHAPQRVRWHRRRFTLLGAFRTCERRLNVNET